MELVYGNDGTNYRVLAKSPEMDFQTESEIRKGYCSYNIPNNLDAYTSPEKYPECVCYATTRLNGALRDDMVLLVKSGKMLNRAARCYYSDAILWAKDDSFYRDEFFNIFKMNFRSSYDTDDMGNGVLPYKDEAYQFPVEENALEPHQIRMILMMLFQNMERMQDLTIMVEDNMGGDAFNERARSVLATIYHYLPYDLRKRCGFASYVDENGRFPGVVIYVMDPTQVKRGDCKIDIDLSYSREDEIKSRIMKSECVEMACYLVNLTPSERSTFFEQAQHMFGNTPFSAVTFVSYLAKENRWKGGDVNKLIPEWAKYVTENGGNKSLVFLSLMELIKSRLDMDHFRSYFLAKLQDADCEFDEIPSDVRQLCYLQDEIPEVAIPADSVVAWYKGRMAKKHIEYSPERLKQLEKSSIDSRWYANVRNEIVDAYRNLENEKNNEKQKWQSQLDDLAAERDRTREASMKVALERDRLSDQLKTANDQLDYYKRENERLSRLNEDLTRDKDRLRQEIDRLMRENERLSRSAGSASGGLNMAGDLGLGNRDNGYGTSRSGGSTIPTSTLRSDKGGGVTSRNAGNRDANAVGVGIMEDNDMIFNVNSPTAVRNAFREIKNNASDMDVDRYVIRFIFKVGNRDDSMDLVFESKGQVASFERFLSDPHGVTIQINKRGDRSKADDIWIDYCYPKFRDGDDQFLQCQKLVGKLSELRLFDLRHIVTIYRWIDLLGKEHPKPDKYVKPRNFFADEYFELAFTKIENRKNKGELPLDGFSKEEKRVLVEIFGLSFLK